MSIFTLEQHILHAARELLRNPNLGLRDLREWSTDKATVADGALVTEVVVHLPDPGVWLAVLQKHDRRGLGGRAQAQRKNTCVRTKTQP